MDGKVVIVTGGRSGIGRAAALRLFAERAARDGLEYLTSGWPLELAPHGVRLHVVAAARPSAAAGAGSIRTRRAGWGFLRPQPARRAKAPAAGRPA